MRFKRVCFFLKISFSFFFFFTSQIYQTARKFVIAEHQAIVYYEWLPAILGTTCPALATYSGFNASADPAMRLDFVTAAFRFGHTTLSNELLRMSNTGTITGRVRLIDAFFAPRGLNASNLDELIMGQR